jgi:long-chain fatty acid transport protein
MVSHRRILDWDDARATLSPQAERPMRTRCGLVGCCAAAASLFTISGAHGGAFAVRSQSAYGQGSSFAGIAAGGSLSSMFWNPANLSDVQRIAIEVVGSGIFPDVDVKLDPQPLLGFPGSHEGNIAHNAFIPSGYAGYRLHDRVVIGVGINTPFGLATEYDGDSVLNQAGVAGKSEVLSLNLNPVVSVEVTDWLALALGAQVQYFHARLTRQALGSLGVSTLEGDDVGFGLTAGIKVTPRPGTAIGLGYRSSIGHELDGTLKTPTAGTFDVTYDGVNLPDLVTLGIRQRITDRFRLMAGAEWSNWSRFDTVAIKGGPAPIDLQFDYDDGWFFSIGGEFDVTQQVAVRAGVGYELGPIDDNVRTYRIPDGDRLHLSGGVSYRLDERFSFDVGYSFVAVEDMDILAANAGGPDANGPFSGRADTYVHYIAAAIKVKL